MKKINIAALIVFISFAGACYQTDTSDTAKTAKPLSTTAPIASETTVEPEKTEVRSGNYNTALEFYNAKNYDKAVTELEAVIMKDDKNQQAHFYLGKSFQALKKPDNAVGAYKKRR
jgi:TolA-binding protein